MTRSIRTEMVELIRRIQAGEGGDDEIGEWFEALKRATGNPNIDFCTSQFDGMTPDQVFDRLYEYHPFLMPPPSTKAQT